MTALSWAADSKNVKAVKILIARGANVNIKNSMGESAIDIAARRDCPEIVSLLRGVGDYVNIEDKKGIELIMWAAKSGNTDEMKIMLKKKINFNAQDENGLTALMHSITEGHEDFVRLMLSQNGINLDIKDKNGVTATMLAKSKNNPNIIKMIEGKIVELAQQARYIIKESSEGGMDLHQDSSTMMKKPYKADMVNLQDSLGKTRLMNAAAAGNTALVSLFLKDGADVNLVTKNGKNALMFAVFNHKVKVVELLLGYAGIEIDMKDNQGKTALIMASEIGDKAIVKMLLDKNADISILDDEGRSAFDRTRNPEIKDMLQAKKLTQELDSIDNETSSIITDLDIPPERWIIAEESKED